MSDLTIDIRRLYGDPFEDGEREFLLDADLAANEVGIHISDITGNEVDGDGDPWSIALDHLVSLANVIADLRDEFPEASRWLEHECGWTAREESS